MSVQLFKSIEAIEQIIGDYYSTNGVTCKDYLVDNKSNSLEYRASVLVSNDSDYVSLGLYFSEEILTKLQNNCPTIKLNQNNIDSFLVVAEEISHFHLLVNRIDNNRKISQFELELQAEVDKLLITAIHLLNQNHNQNLVHLTHILYNLCKTYVSNSDMYDQATSFAACFWYKMIRNGINESKYLKYDSIKKQLQDYYNCSIADKYSILNKAS